MQKPQKYQRDVMPIPPASQPPPLLYHAIKAHSVPLSFFLSFFLSLIDAALNARTPLKTNLNFL